MDDFWNKLLEEGIHPASPDDGLRESLDYMQKYSSESIPSKDTVISILFNRIEKTITECFFGDINLLIISLLSELASVSSMNHFMQPGLFESIFVLFMNDDATFEKSVEFLDKFFDRPDIHSVFEDLIMVAIVNLANYSPPKPSLWRFMCKFMTKFGETIENMCDFTALESNGLMPIFTRSLIWDYRNIYQNPPDKKHEESFWLMWKSILTRYKDAVYNNDEDKNKNEDEEDEEGPREKPVISLFKGLLNEIRLSIYYGLSSAHENGKYVSNTPLEVWKLLHEINEDELISFLETQIENDALKVALNASLLYVDDKNRSRVQKMLDEY